MRKNLIAVGVLATVLITTNFTQAISTAQQEGANGNQVSSGFIPEDTPVRLRLSQTLSSATAKVNDKVDFEVVEEIKVGSLVVIPQGATAIGTVTEAHTKKSFGRAGKLNVNIDYVRLANGDKVALRAVKGGSGGNHKGAMTGAVVATAIVFFPAAPLFFFIKGKNIEIPKGTEITAFVGANTPVDPSKFGNNNVASSSSASAQSTVVSSTETPGFGTVLVKSNPDASDITIDGKFVGSTTSTLRLTPGEHTILIEKAGFKPWQRTMSVSSGNVTVDATLEKN
jgi:hypothetical protein